MNELECSPYPNTSERRVVWLKYVSLNMPQNICIMVDNGEKTMNNSHEKFQILLLSINHYYSIVSMITDN